MKVSDILKIKGGTLFTATPDDSLAGAVQHMAERDIGSLVVMAQGKLVGMLTFREVMRVVAKNGGTVGSSKVSDAMNANPPTAGMDTPLDEARRLILEEHARYVPVMEKGMLMGVISFYDVAKAVVDSQNFENQMLKAYIRDWPAEAETGKGDSNTP
jgi:CBS domain-containing protein